MKSKVRCVVLLCLLAVPARGQTAVSLDCETNAACAALYEQAAQQSKAGQLSEAEKSYKKAYEVSHDGRLLFNIARVLDKRGRAEEAKTYYRQFIQAPLEDEAQKTKARAYVEQLEAKPAAPSTPTMMPPTASPTTTLSGEQNAKPVYKKGWFWGVMLGSVAAVGLGIGLGIGLSSRGATVPNGTNTAEPTF